MNLIESLQCRYATKRMNGNKIPSEKLENILEAIHLAPSSMGVQPFKVFVIQDEATKKAISEKACPQPQILESDAVIIFAAWTNFEKSKVDAYMENIVATRNTPRESLKGFEENILGLFSSKTPEELVTWAAKQTYISLGFGLVAAATEQVDATPMEGFNPPALDEVLGLKEKGLTSTLMLTLGYRNEANDYLVHAKKVRRSKELFFEKI